MGELFTMFVIGMVLYMLFSKNGGMECCRGRQAHHSSDSRREYSTTVVNSSSDEKDVVIYLTKDAYQVLSDPGSYEGHDRGIAQDAPHAP